MSKKKYIMNPRYGLFEDNQEDVNDMNRMDKKGYEVFKETFSWRIYKLKEKSK